jgi:hypothetical protein
VYYFHPHFSFHPQFWWKLGPSLGHFIDNSIRYISQDRCNGNKRLTFFLPTPSPWHICQPTLSHSAWSLAHLISSTQGLHDKKIHSRKKTLLIPDVTNHIMQTKNRNLFINSDAFYKTKIHTIVVDWIVTSSHKILVQAIFFTLC